MFRWIQTAKVEEQAAGSIWSGSAQLVAFVSGIYNYYTHPYSFFLLSNDRLMKRTARYGRMGLVQLVGLEIVWTLLPTITLFFLAVPSFTLIFSQNLFLDEKGLRGLPAVSVKITGNQWFWNYAYSQETFTHHVQETVNIQADKGSQMAFLTNIGDSSLSVTDIAQFEGGLMPGAFTLMFLPGFNPVLQASANFSDLWNVG